MLKIFKAAGVPRQSLVDSMLDEYESAGVVNEEYEITMQYVGGAMYGGEPQDELEAGHVLIGIRRWSSDSQCTIICSLKTDFESL